MMISALSLLSCTFLITTFLKSKKLKVNDQLTPIAWLSVSDAIWAVWAFACYLPAVTGMQKLGDSSTGEG